MGDLTLREACALVAQEPGTVLPIAICDLRRLALWRVRGDGRCLWYSIVAADALSRGCNVDELQAQDQRGEVVRAARQLRRSVCQELRDAETGGLKADYAPFWATGEEGTNAARSEQEYLQGLTTGQVYGGHLELHLAAEIIGRVIVVIDLPNARTGSWARLCAHKRADIDPNSAPLMLLRSNLHYDAAYSCGAGGASSLSLSPRRGPRPREGRRRAFSSFGPERSRLRAA